MAGLPLGVAPSYSIVGGISGQGHAGPGAGNSIFGQARFEDDKPWLQTLSGRRGMQPNIAHQMNRIGADGVVRDPLGSGAEYRHDGFVAGVADAVIPGPNQGQGVYKPELSYNQLEALLASPGPDSDDLANLDKQIADLQKAIASTPGLDPGPAQAALDQMNILRQEYSDAVTSGFSKNHPTDASKKYIADAVSTLATYANIYNETDLFPGSEALQANAIVDLLDSEANGDDSSTLLFFMYRVQEAYLQQRGFWNSSNIAQAVQVGGFNATGDYNFGAIATECSTLMGDGHGHDIAVIAQTFLSADPAGTFKDAPTNPPWGNSGLSPSIWGTYTPTGGAGPVVVNGVSSFDLALFDAVTSVHALYQSVYPNGNSNGGGGGGNNTNGNNSKGVSPGPSGNTTPVNPSDGGLIAAVLVAALGALAYKAYA